MPRLCNHCARCKKPLPRVCTGCGKEKPDDAFPWTTCRGKRLQRAQCRDCCNDYLRKRYYDKIRREQIKVFRERAS